MLQAGYTMDQGQHAGKLNVLWTRDWQAVFIVDQGRQEGPDVEQGWPAVSTDGSRGDMLLYSDLLYCGAGLACWF